ncbi:MAG: hemerythrin family protein [Elusimicrobia bacterium]|nr:hemerythrin family protein [Elusimicrobiota bacterium]
MIYSWDASLETGNDIIDTQHKQLIEALNGLILAYQGGKGPDELLRTLDFLSAYVIRHFTDEEALQVQYNYPDYQRHRLYHNEFRRTIEKLSAEISEKGPTDELILVTIKTVADWLIHHIKSDDFKLAAYINFMSGRSPIL